MNDPQTPPHDAPFFHVEKLYLKDLSFESPHAPASFSETPDPKIDFNLETTNTGLGEEHVEVALRLEVRITSGEQTLFLVELTYAGLFQIRNIPAEHIPMLMGIECPNIIFPYARHVVSQVVSDGGFKPLVLDPINFAGLFQQQMRANAEAED